MRLFSLRT